MSLTWDDVEEDSRILERGASQDAELTPSHTTVILDGKTFLVLGADGAYDAVDKARKALKPKRTTKAKTPGAE